MNVVDVIVEISCSWIKRWEKHLQSRKSSAIDECPINRLSLIVFLNSEAGWIRGSPFFKYWGQGKFTWTWPEMLDNFNLKIWVRDDGIQEVIHIEIVINFEDLISFGINC